MISIIMAYHQRYEILLKTLESIQSKEVKPDEIVIVDDNSPTRLELDNIYDFDIKIDYLTKENKIGINPAFVYNKALEISKGDIVIIQNPECYHYGNIVDYTKNNIEENVYLSFACYSGRKDLDFDNITFYERGASDGNGDSWYNHSRFRACGYHFTSAILRSDIEKIDGYLFNPEMFHGIAYDDDELVWRIKNKGMDFRIIDSECVIHQYHYNIKPTNYIIPNLAELQEHNRQTFLKIKNGGI